MNAQYYENTYALTPLNSPCQGCKISAKPILRNGDYGDAVTGKNGGRKHVSRRMLLKLWVSILCLCGGKI